MSVAPHIRRGWLAVTGMARWLYSGVGAAMHEVYWRVVDGPPKDLDPECWVDPEDVVLRDPVRGWQKTQYDRGLEAFFEDGRCVFCGCATGETGGEWHHIYEATRRPPVRGIAWLRCINHPTQTVCWVNPLLKQSESGGMP